MKIEDWAAVPQPRWAQATHAFHDVDGTVIPRGSIGGVCDVLDLDGYVVVDFPETGPTLCDPQEIRPTAVR